MKNTFFSGLLLLCLLLAGCGGKKQSLATETVATNVADTVTATKLDADTVQQMAEVEEIPEVLRNNKEAREYFESMNKVVDDYEKTVDNIELEKIKAEKENPNIDDNIDSKDEKDKKKPNRLQRIAIRLVKFKQKTADFMNKISSLPKKESKLAKGMSKKESEAFAKMCSKLVNKIAKAKRRR